MRNCLNLNGVFCSIIPPWSALYICHRCRLKAYCLVTNCYSIKSLEAGRQCLPWRYRSTPYFIKFMVGVVGSTVFHWVIYPSLSRESLLKAQELTFWIFFFTLRSCLWSGNKSHKVLVPQATIVLIFKILAILLSSKYVLLVFQGKLQYLNADWRLLISNMHTHSLIANWFNFLILAS